MLETQISHIFERILIGLIGWAEILAISSIIGVFITSIFLGLQYQKQSKATSSKLIIIILNRLRDEDFRDVVEKMKKDQNIGKLDLKRYLTYLEYIAIFWDDGILSFHHVDQIFGMNFRLLNKNKQSLKILDDIPFDSDLYYYINKIRKELV